MKLLCIDVGNSNTQIGIVGSEGVEKTEKVSTESIGKTGSDLSLVLDRMISSSGAVGVSFCSVVPGIYPHLLKQLRIFTSRLFNLNSKTAVGLEMDYPNPSEIGQDRLASAVGAQEYFGTPSIIIDLGTATTIDLVTEERGYEGGVIAPGLKLMSHYLHEKTALLPATTPEDWKSSGMVGKSTKEAIAIGCRIGYAGMIDALVSPILAELENRGIDGAKILVTGGDGDLFQNIFPDVVLVSDLTLRGLYAGFVRNRDQIVGV